MTYGYDLERLVVALENVENAAVSLARSHAVEDWMLYRLSHIRSEALSLKREIVAKKERMKHDTDKSRTAHDARASRAVALAGDHLAQTVEQQDRALH